MKIICLNTWGGRAGRAVLLEFFSAHRDVDVFCLQEVWSAPYEHLDGAPAGGLAIDHSQIMTYGMQEISELLSPTHVAYFKPHHLNNYGLMMLVKKGLAIISEGDLFVHRERGYIPEGDVGHHARNVQWVTTEKEETPITILNFHGLWNGNGKTDSEDRLMQSARIKSFLSSLATPYVLCGDFNLLPDTQSIRELESLGLRNLIKEFEVKSTRTSLYKKQEKYADYIFLHKGLRLASFQVLADVVSDHCPLYLELQ